MRFSTSFFRTACLGGWFVLSLGLISCLSWSLLTPDPFAVVRQTSLAWTEGIRDLYVHAAAFAGLSLVWFGIFPVSGREIPAVVVFWMLLYCLSMEFLQSFVPGRDCNTLDAMANVCGALCGLMFWQCLRLSGAAQPERHPMAVVSPR